MWNLAEAAMTYSRWAVLQPDFQKRSSSRLTVAETASLERLLQGQGEVGEVILRRPEVWKRTPGECREKLDHLDSEATRILVDLWKRIEASRLDHGNFLTKLPPDLLRTFKGKQAADWMKSARRTRYCIDLFILCPKVLPLPRTLCILWCKSQSLFGQPTISDRTFEDSLKELRFEDREIQRIKNLLSSLCKQEDGPSMSVEGLSARLQSEGVTANPHGSSVFRTP